MLKQLVVDRAVSKKSRRKAEGGVSLAVGSQEKQNFREPVNP